MYSDDSCGYFSDAKAALAGLQPQFRISLTLAVTDGRALWSAAAARLLAASGMNLDDVIDVLGPCEDPSINDCIATLAKPDTFPGCVLDDFWIDGLARTPPRLEPSVVQGDARSDGVDRSVRRSAARRAVVPALHLLAAVPTNRNRLD